MILIELQRYDRMKKVRCFDKRNKEEHMKKRAFLMMVVTCLLLLTSCGGRSESEIQEDFISQNSYINAYGMNVTSFEITNRSTKGKTDEVSVRVEAENNQFSMVQDCNMHYEKYNNGWKLDSVTQKDIDYTANNAEITQEMADAWAKDFFGEGLTFTKRSDYTNHICFYYTRTEENFYLIKEYADQLDLYFTPDNQWQAEPSEEQTSETADLIGEWTYKDAERSYWIKIIDFDMDDRRVRYAYELHDKKNMAAGFDWVYDAKSSDEIVGSCYSYMGDGKYDWHMDPDESEVREFWFYIGKQADAKNGTGAGVNFNGYWLTRN